MPRIKILLAEDDGDDQKLFRDFLQHREDILILPIAENGVDLITKLEEIPGKGSLPDLIILDQNMPRQNGLQTLQYLKESEPYRNIPVVIYSTYCDNNLIKKCTDHGACAVVTKPISREGYEEMLDELLKFIP